MARRFQRYSPAERAAALARYNDALARGLNDSQAATLAGVSISTLQTWRDRATDAAQRPSTVARRKCLRCGVGFRSTWAGHRVCDPCARSQVADGLPDAWGATSTVGVADRG